MMAASLLFVCLLAKLLTVPSSALFGSAWAPAAYFYQDLALALILYGLERGLSVAWISRFVYSILVIYTALNVPITRILATPMTWPSLRAARGTLWDSIRYYISPSNLGLVICVLLAGLAIPLLLRRYGAKIPAAAAAGAAVFAAMGPVAVARVDTHGMHRNAAAAFVYSLLPRSPAPPAPGVRHHGGDGDRVGEALTHLRGIARGRNVILVGLESTAAGYLGLYGVAEELMPNLSRIAAGGIVFENAYTVYPESVKILLPVLFSVYPALDVQVERNDFSRLVSLAQVLSGSGYASALFHSGRFMYLGMDRVVQAGGFLTAEDAGDIGGNHNSSFGVDEPSSVRRILRWIDALPPEKPFFVTYLPIAGHHPYETPDHGPHPERDEFARYRNALLYSDASLGGLMEGLRERKIFDDTIWVFYGDHGEAFGQHPGNFGHTFFLYEENVRVPLVVALPGLLSHSLRIRRAASLIDLPPTILDLLDLPIPPSYQGRSLLEGTVRPALFFTDYSLGLLGLRDGNLKLIHELESGRSRLFDLSNDPSEKIDIAGDHPGMVRRYRGVLLSWCASLQEEFR